MSTRLVDPTDRYDRRAADNRAGHITTEQAAAILGVAARTVRTWADAGRLTVVNRTLGGEARGGWRTFDLTEVEALARLLTRARLTTGTNAPRWDSPDLASWAPTAAGRT